LEVNASESEIFRLINTTSSAPAVHVVLSANVFVAALRALCLAWATSARVFVRPSSREPLFFGELFGLVAEFPDSEISIVDSLRPGPQDEVHLYGKDSTIRAICASLPANQAIRAHGSGLGIALVSPDADVAEAASSLVRDIVPFDQRGCLSPRAVFVACRANETTRFVDSLKDALSAWEKDVPIGVLDSSERAELVRYEDSICVLGSLSRAGASAIGVLQTSRALLIPPVGRHITVVPCDNHDAANALIAPLCRAITCVGVAGDMRDPFISPLLSLCPGARKTVLGKMQMPPLDGPVDQRRPVVQHASDFSTEQG
jgi:hypothetical protein